MPKTKTVPDVPFKTQALGLMWEPETFEYRKRKVSLHAFLERCQYGGGLVGYEVSVDGEHIPIVVEPFTDPYFDMLCEGKDLIWTKSGDPVRFSARFMKYVTKAVDRHLAQRVSK